MTEGCSAGFPHSDISGSMDICSSPKLFAAYHVFHRLLVPRHPPCALLCLTAAIYSVTWRSRVNFRCSCCFFKQGFPPVYPRMSCDGSFNPSDIFLSVCGFQGTLPGFAGIFSCPKQTLFRTMGLSGLEPPTSRLSGVRSNRLSYKPFLIWQPPTLPHRLQCSTIGRPGLNHRVRDGYGCFPWAHRHQQCSVISFDN